MKILHLSGAITWRGGEQQLFYLQEAMQSVDIKQVIVCPRNSLLCKRIENTPHLSVISFKKGFLFNLFLAFKLSMICKREKIDIIHVHDSHSHTYAFISAWLFGNKTPLVVHRRVAFKMSKGRFSLLKYNHKYIRRIICVSEAVKEMASESINNKAVLKVVHSGIDLNRFPHKTKTNRLKALLNLNDDAIIIGNTSAIDHHKDYFTFVDSAVIILNSLPQACFVIMGNGPLENEITEYIKHKGLSNKFFLTGFRNNVHELLPDFDVFLMTTKSEGLGTSILDAFACNVPVVSTNTGGIPEIIEHGKSGLLGEVGNSARLAQLVVKLINDKSLLKTITEGAAEKLKSFTKEEMANKIIEVYESI